MRGVNVHNTGTCNIIVLYWIGKLAHFKRTYTGCVENVFRNDMFWNGNISEAFITLRKQNNGTTEILSITNMVMVGIKYANHFKAKDTAHELYWHLQITNRNKHISKLSCQLDRCVGIS